MTYLIISKLHLVIFRLSHKERHATIICSLRLLCCSNFLHVFVIVGTLRLYFFIQYLIYVIYVIHDICFICDNMVNVLVKFEVFLC